MIINEVLIEKIDDSQNFIILKIGFRVNYFSICFYDLLEFILIYKVLKPNKSN